MTLVDEKKTRKPVSIKWQTVFVFIPILNMYALLRVEKFWLGLGLGFIIGFTSGIIEVILEIPFPWGLGLSLVLPILPFVYFIRKWSRQWNEKASKELSTEY